MPFTPDELRDLPLIISAPRFATYLQATGNDRQRALALYEWNLTLSSAFIVPLQVCEVAVRNGVAEAIEKVHGPNWPWSKGFLRSLPPSEAAVRLQSRKRPSRCGSPPAHDREGDCGTEICLLGTDFYSRAG